MWYHVLIYHNMVCIICVPFLTFVVPQNSPKLRQDWARIPFPLSRQPFAWQWVLHPSFLSTFHYCRHSLYSSSQRLWCQVLSFLPPQPQDPHIWSCLWGWNYRYVGGVDKFLLLLFVHCMSANRSHTAVLVLWWITWRKSSPNVQLIRLMWWGKILSLYITLELHGHFDVLVSWCLSFFYKRGHFK